MNSRDFESTGAARLVVTLPLRALARRGVALGSLLVLLAPLWAGCSSLYTVTFTRGTAITVQGKPKYDKATDSYLFTDSYGRPCRVPAISIREIAPASDNAPPVKLPAGR